jgi:predicted DCC family thiol-disulfide oxidoreductase YuxK
MIFPYWQEILSDYSLQVRSPFDPSLWHNWIFKFSSHPMISPYILIVLLGQIGFLILSIFGIGGNFCLFIATILTLNVNHRGGVINDGGNNLSEILLIYLNLIPYRDLGTNPIRISVGRSFQMALANGTSLLIRLQIVLVYLCAGIYKSNGELWSNGMALYYILQSDVYSHPIVKEIILKVPLLSVAGTYFTVGFQLLFPMLIWVKKFRPWILAAGIFLHLNISFVMGLTTFGFVMCAVYTAFLPESFSKKILAYWRGEEKITVGFDGNCSICMRFSRFLKMFDYQNSIIIDDALFPKNKVLQKVDSETRLNQMVAVEASGIQSMGIHAIAEVLKRIPMLWGGYLIIELLIKLRLGGKIYEIIANSRPVAECRSEGCSLSARDNFVPKNKE